MSIISNLLDGSCINATLAQADDFGKWIVKELWNQYQDEKMNKRIIVENEIKALGLKLPNGMVNKEYNYKLVIHSDSIKEFRLEGLLPLGLKATPVEGETNSCMISGVSTEAGDFGLTLKVRHKCWVEGEEEAAISIPIAFNPDPRSLWKNIPTSKDIPFYKEDTAAEYVKVEESGDSGPRKDIVAASKRGRSHAQEGKARDDHFKLYHCEASDWYIIAVADGAGSAKFSRKGSQIACDTVVDYCKDKLMDCAEFEEKIRAYKNADDEESARKNMANVIYGIVANAAFKAHRNINDVAAASKDINAVPKDFATTLMFAICKKFDFGWFVASFWVGDGAMCIYNEEKQTFKMLGVPDEGEFSGQTRFLTMPEIFRDPKDVMARLRFSIEEDFTALMLMTDGVSDPMFETDNNLNSIDKWNELWKNLKNGFPQDNVGGIDLSDDNEEAKNQLLGWLDFWSPGNHDDRTIAILY